MAFLGFLGKLMDSNERELKKLRVIVADINEQEDSIKKLSDDELKAKTSEFKQRLKQEETIDDILTEAFALVREASKRTTGLRHFDVQLIAGLSFHQGKIAEQKTGEGKTLSATSALYLNGLTERGTHLITVNDYLARRDCGWMAPIYHALGLSVGVIYSGQGQQPAAIYDPEFEEKGQSDERLRHLKPVTRKEAYAADITYGTNNEFGFDYLRDNMVQNREQQVQREHHFAIVDEVDSILVDEARTPLIISAPDTEPTSKYYDFAKMITILQGDGDYEVDEKHRTANLTERGIKKVEKHLGIDNLYEKDFQTIHHLEQALKARTLFHRDKQYVVKDDQVIIVDEHTGRLMFGRRYSEGLHQAIEAKEDVKIQQESRTLATVSLQNYFRMYEKLSGMTGTAATEAEEFKKIYDLEVLVVPTNQPMIRKNEKDIVYKTLRAKYGAVVAEVSKARERGQPVLLGTRSIEQNEIIAKYLKRKKIPHNLLNAKHHQKEAQILAEAGKVGAVTVATNMAGRGVDIVLGGAQEDEKDKKSIEKWKAEHQKVIELGGLYVIGTERHESRRIDNQLRGRSGRQGDPGRSKFFVSLDDEIMRIFGGEQVQRLMTTLKIPEDQPIEAGLVSKAIEQAQVKVEGFHFDSRKRLVDYDDIMNKQREIFYKRRNKILEDSEDKKNNKLKERITDILSEEITQLVAMRAPEGFTEKEIETLLQEFYTIIPFDPTSQARLKKEVSKIKTSQDLTDKLVDLTTKTYQQREKQVGLEIISQVEKFTLLNTSDRLWMDHLDAISELRDGIGLRGGQDTALAEYKKEAFGMFESLISQTDYEVARTIFRIQVRPTQQPVSAQFQEKKPEAELPEAQESKQAEKEIDKPKPRGKTKKSSVDDFAAALEGLKASPMATATTNRQQDSGVVRKGKKIGRNDPCPCGAINPNTNRTYKYKKCGLINAPHHRG